MNPVLDGLRVLEVSTMAFVPSAAAVLADWGADVVKVEHPVHGDTVRGSTVYGIAPDGWRDGFTMMWEGPNRGKRSLALDITGDAGRKVLLDLVDRADVFLTSFLDRTREKLKIDPDSILERNPRIVYGLGTGYGRRGPLAGRGGFDIVSLWQRAGISRLCTPPDAAEPTTLPSPAFGDNISGMALAGGIAAALYARERTGRGGVVDVSLLGTGLWAAQHAVVTSSLLGAEPPVIARDRVHNPLVGTYRTGDGRFLALCMRESQRYWPGFCRAIGRPDWIDDPRYRDADARADNATTLIAALDGTFAQRDLAVWSEALNGQDGAWDIAQSMPEVLADQQARENGYIQDVEYGSGRTVSLVASPVQFDAAPARLTPAPEHGAHTEEVLLELGRDWDSIAELRAQEVIP